MNLALFRISARAIGPPIAADRKPDSEAFPIPHAARDQIVLHDGPGIAEPARDLGGMLKAIGREVSGRAAGARAGIRSMFALRIAAAYRSGLSKAQIAAIVRGIRQEMQAALRAAADNTAAELTGLRAAVVEARQSRQARTATAKGGAPQPWRLN